MGDQNAVLAGRQARAYEFPSRRFFHVIETGAHAIFSHDPAVDLDPALIKAAEEIGADLIVMASHIPNLMDYVWPSNGGTIAGHSKASVFVVRM